MNQIASKLFKKIFYMYYFWQALVFNHVKTARKSLARIRKTSTTAPFPDTHMQMHESPLFFRQRSPHNPRLHVIHCTALSSTKPFRVALILVVNKEL